MKFTYVSFGILLTLGAIDPTWARSIPLGPGVSLSDIRVGRQAASKWDRRTEANSRSIVELGAWYRYCPVRTNIVLNSKNEAEVVLSNGKRIMLSDAALRTVVEADLEKYAAFMY